MNKKINFKYIRSIANHPGSSQRSFAKKIGLSLGKLNYCLRALKQKGLVKGKNFKNNKNKQKLHIHIDTQRNKHKNKTYIKFHEIKNERIR